jgi:hypothetical protein
VLLLPFIDSQHLYEQYRFDEPWNSPNNQQLGREIQSWLHCPSNDQANRLPVTDYVVVVGKDTLFPGAGTRSLSEITDGAENTILLVEIANSDIHWMEPRDLNVDEMSFAVNDQSRPSISAPHPAGPAVVFADRITSYRLDATIRPETLRALTTIAGGEPVSKEALNRREADIVSPSNAGAPASQRLPDHRADREFHRDMDCRAASCRQSVSVGTFSQWSRNLSSARRLRRVETFELISVELGSPGFPIERLKAPQREAS